MSLRLRALDKEFGYSFFPMISHFSPFLGAAPSYLCGFPFHMALFNPCARSLSIKLCIQDTPDYFYMGSICSIDRHKSCITNMRGHKIIS
jgi:hypothetical protein